MALIIGCSSDKRAGSGVVTGKITYNNQAVNGGTLKLHSTGGAGELFNVPITQEGTYRAADVPVGEYTVVIQPSEGMTSHMPKEKPPGIDDASWAEMKTKAENTKTPPTIKIPDKYKARTSSPLKLTVTKENKEENFTLTD